MSEFPELDKLTEEIEGGKPSNAANSALLMIAVGILIFAFLFLCIYVFFKALRSI